MVGPHRLPCETPVAGHAADRPAEASRWILPATILGSSLSFIDSSVVNVALPAIGRGLDTDLSTLQWVANGYMLTLASLILLGDRRGTDSGAAASSTSGCRVRRRLPRLRLRALGRVADPRAPGSGRGRGAA